MAKKVALAVVSPAELAADTTEATGFDLAAEPINAFELLLGGRTALIASLSIDSTPEIRDLLKQLLDPHMDRYSIGYLASQAGIGLLDLLRAYRNSTLAKVQVLAVNQLAEKIPHVVEDVLRRAVPYDDRCKGCDGAGVTRVRPTKKCPDPDPPDVECSICHGKKTVVRLPTLEYQRLVLEMAEVIKPPKGGPTLLNQFNIGTAAASASSIVPGSLEQMQQAVTDLLFKRAPVIDVDASVVDDGG